MQKKVQEFNKNMPCHEKPMPVHARILDIQSELGELAKEYLKNSKYGTQNFDLTEDFKLEYGDVLYSLLSLGNEVGLNAEEELDKVLEKYKKRIIDKNSMGSGR